MDILKHGSEMEVIGPISLKNKVRDKLEKHLRAIDSYLQTNNVVGLYWAAF